MRTLPLVLLPFVSACLRAEVIETDVVVYGATAGGVAAACTAAKMGKTAVIAEFGRHVGGLTSGGLGNTDIGNKAAIGGFARAFYKRLGAHYGKPEAWTFEPSVAERELRALLDEHKVAVRFSQRLASVKKNGARIIETVMEDGTIYRGKMFIDAGYEGDLMAKAGVKYRIGREANAEFGETLNGARLSTPKHQFLVPVDPYVNPGDPPSGVLTFIDRESIGAPGEADASVQAYNFRLCLTRNPANRLPIEPPPGYEPARYELLGRYFEALAAAGKKASSGMFLKIDMVTPDKTDINNNGPFSTDYIGMNHSYPDADYATRERVWQETLLYTQGLLTFLKTDPRVPEAMRAELGEWGLCRDEFADTHGWPHQMYIREARRMIGAFVMTEKVCRWIEKPSDSVGLGAYGMDSHNCRRIIRDGHAENEGDVQVGVKGPYPISYRSIIPRAIECENLLVPVCLSATHIAYGSIRMEPVFMILGQSAATAACQAIDAGTSVQAVPYAPLRAQLLKDGQLLDWDPNVPNQSGANAAGEQERKLSGLVLDDADAEKIGDWLPGSLPGSQHIGTGYIHDNNANKGASMARWTPDIPEAGEYMITVHFPPHSNRATNVPVTIEPEGKMPVTVPIDERAKSGTAALGKFTLEKGKSIRITVSNKGTDGHVIVDGIQFEKVK